MDARIAGACRIAASASGTSVDKTNLYMANCDHVRRGEDERNWKRKTVSRQGWASDK